VIINEEECPLSPIRIWRMDRTEENLNKLKNNFTDFNEAHITKRNYNNIFDDIAKVAILIIEMHEDL